MLFQHNLVFAAWLVQEFGQDVLRGENGVLDVAGGGGTLSYELSVRYGISSTVWDNRSIVLSSMLRRKIKKLTRSRDRCIPAGDVPLPPGSRQESTSAVDRSELMQWVRDVAKLDPVDDGAVTEQVHSCLVDPTKLPFNQIKQSFPLHINSPDVVISLRESESLVTTNEHLAAGDHLSEVVNRSSILVGMHPDQVTVAIVDAALRYRRPFAVVPCCVFKEMFPMRHLSSGKPVESYEDLIEFILQKNDDFVRFNLPFMGRNVVLFHNGNYGSELGIEQTVPLRGSFKEIERNCESSDPFYNGDNAYAVLEPAIALIGGNGEANKLLYEDKGCDEYVSQGNGSSTGIVAEGECEDVVDGKSRKKSKPSTCFH